VASDGLLEIADAISRIGHKDVKPLERSSLFEVDLRNFEPHTPRNGKGHKETRKELRDAIIREKGEASIEDSRTLMNGKPVSVKVLFRLWRGSSNVPDTRSKKDLDNLLKPVLDVFQMYLDAQKNEPGLGLLENDIQVYEINVRKHIVETEREEGIHINIFPFES